MKLVIFSTYYEEKSPHVPNENCLLALIGNAGLAYYRFLQRKLRKNKNNDSPIYTCTIYNYIPSF